MMSGTRFALVLMIIAACASPRMSAAQDTTPPTIASVAVSPAMVSFADTVRVEVIVTDDVAVAGVVADGVALTGSGGALWQGEVAVNPTLGPHSVTVVAADAAGNERTDTSGGYTTAQVVGLRNYEALSTTAVAASPNYLFKVWGKATYVDENTFSLDDGSGRPVRVVAPGHGICNDDFVAARGILDASAPPAKITSALYSIYQSAPRTLMSIGNATVGNDLQTSVSGSLPYPVPYGTSLPVTIMSSDPSKVRLAKTLTDAGSASIVLTVPGGSSSIPAFYVHGLASSGVVQMTATAPGCLGAAFTVTLAPSGFYISSPGSFSTTTFSANTTVRIHSARLSPAIFAPAAAQRLRGGIDPVTVPVTSSDLAVGTITSSPLTFNASSSYADTAFDPVGAGITVIQVGVPDGFTAPSSGRQYTATVTAADINMGASSVGLNLQYPLSISLEAAPPEPVDVVVSVGSTATATVTQDPLVEGTGAVTFTGVSGTSVGTVYVQGRSLGTTSLTATAVGYNSKTSTVTVDPSGFIIGSPGSISTTSFSTNTQVYVYPARLNPTTLAYSSGQRIRGGLTVSVPVVSSAPAVGSITTSPLTFGPNGNVATTEFDPVGPGNATVSVGTAPGFSQASTYAQIAATVTAANVLGVDRTVGLDLQTTSYAQLEVAPPAPVSITVTVADTSIATIATSATEEGGGTITFSDVSNTNQKSFYVQGRGIGSTTVTLSALGYTSGVKTITVTPSGFAVQSPYSISTTVYSSNTGVQIGAARLDPNTLAYQTSQPLRAGLTVSVPVTSSDPTVGVITSSPLVFSGNTTYKSTFFDPLAVGDTTITVDAPPGFSTPSDRANIAVTVSVPGISTSDRTVGRDLQQSASASLAAAPPAPVDVVVTVGNSDIATVTKTATLEGTGSITFNNVSSTAGQSFYVQGRGIGTTSLTVAAGGYESAVKTITVDPSGFVISSPGSITTTAGAANITMQIAAARLNPTNFTYAATQSLRGGLSVEVPVVCSDAAVGQVTVSPLVFGGNVTYVSTAFDPLGVGTCVLSVDVPAGFSTPTSNKQITAIVNP